MPDIRLAQSNFTSGQISPLMAARGELSAYQNGAEKLENARIHFQGGATTRWAMRSLFQMLGGTKLVPFVFDSTQTYVFLLSHTRLDVVDGNGSLIATVTGATWQGSMLNRLDWASQGDTTILTHPDMKMQIVKRTGATTFTVSDFAFDAGAAAGTLKQPYFKFADPAMTLTPSATTGSITLTASSPGFFVSGHVGVIVRYKGKQIRIDAVTNLTTATGTVLETLPGITADTDWDEAVFSPVRGYANSVTWYANRLWLGGSKSLKIGLWASQVGKYFNFDVGTALDSEAIWETIPATLLSEIRYLLDFRHLLIYGDRAVFYIPQSVGKPITPTNIEIRRQQPFGTSFVKPQDFDGAAVHVQENGLAVRENLWDDINQSYSSTPISAFTDVVNSPKEVATLYGGESTESEAYIFFVNSDGSLAVLHSNRDQKLLAWVKWTTKGTITAIAATVRKVFVSVTRTLNGTPVSMLEIFDEARAPLDSLIRVTSGTPTRTFSGFNTLANETVNVVTQGHDLGLHTVSAGGVITLSNDEPAVTEIEAGFGFSMTIRPMPFDFDAPATGNARGLMKRGKRAMIVAKDAIGLRVDGADWLPSFKGDDFSTPNVGFTGTIERKIKGVNREQQFDVVIPAGNSGTVLGLTREAFVGG